MAKALTVTTTIEHGYTCYKFNSRGTSYNVLTRDHKTYDVWSKRESYGNAHDRTLKCYDSLNELAKRSKALANLAELIKA